MYAPFLQLCARGWQQFWQLDLSCCQESWQVLLEKLATGKHSLHVQSGEPLFTVPCVYMYEGAMSPGILILWQLVRPYNPREYGLNPAAATVKPIEKGLSERQMLTEEERKEHGRESDRRYYCAHREERLPQMFSYAKDYRKTHQPELRAYNRGWWLKKYGITSEQYDLLLESQDGKCAICGKPNIKKGKVVRMGIDHNHKTGKVRGLLCYKCNQALGQIGDDPTVALKLYEYTSHWAQEPIKSL